MPKGLYNPTGKGLAVVTPNHHTMTPHVSTHLGEQKLGASPGDFDSGKSYIVQVSQAVPIIPGDPNSPCLRPSDLNQVTGDYANTIAQYITASKEL